MKDERINYIEEEFSQNVLDERGVETLVSGIVRNREFAVRKASDMGLDPDFLSSEQQGFCVGPFVSPAPVSTIFAGKVENFMCAAQAGERITRKLTDAEFPAEQYLSVQLAMTEVSTKGTEAKDAFIVPKNGKGNQKILLIGKPERGISYGALSVSRSDVDVEKALGDSFNQYTERYPQLKRKGIGKVIPNAIAQDVADAFSSASAEADKNVPYLKFAQALNKRIAQRIDGGGELPITCVDTQYYSPFLKEGIKDPVKFLVALQNVGFPIDGTGFVKVVDEQGISQVLSVQEITDSDVILRYKSKDETVSFRDLQTSDADISACKELSYLLCFTNLVQVVYGSENSGYYEPFSIAKQRSARLGFTPTMYRVQPEIPFQYDSIATVFDFYRELTLSDSDIK